jgi:hypothetical protein
VTTKVNEGLLQYTDERRTQNRDERNIAKWVVNRPKKIDHIVNLLSVVERLAPEGTIGDREFIEGFRVRGVTRAGAAENRDVSV